MILMKVRSRRREGRGKEQGEEEQVEEQGSRGTGEQGR
jgi:hypothetical protein